MSAETTGTFTVKRGLADMLRGGVIMDVVNAEQAKVAEDAGAVSVMALERVPADIRRDGGVARMSDPLLIEGIIDAVTIPVMAKARIGHFAEAQVLQSLGVDFIDESEVLTPADEAHHIDKWPFTVPFVCGATNLGEALRRISEGAAMIRSKGEAGTGNIVEAVRHLRSILGDLRAVTQADSRPSLYGWAKVAQCADRAGAGGRGGGTAAGAVVLRRRYRDARGCSVGDAARGRGRLRRLWHLQVLRPGPHGVGRRRGHGALRGCRARGQGFARPGRGDARARGLTVRRASRRPGVVAELSPAGVSGPGPLVGVLGLQGDVREHVAALGAVGARSRLVKRPAELEGLDGLIIPGGESTTLSMLLESTGLFDAVAERLAAGLPVFGTCAGLILVARQVLDGRADQRTFGALDAVVRRNGYGRQRQSFEADVVLGSGEGPPLPTVFIRAPFVVSVGDGVDVLAELDGVPVLVRQGRVLASSFHPELTADRRVHRLFAEMCGVEASGGGAGGGAGGGLFG